MIRLLKNNRGLSLLELMIVAFMAVVVTMGVAGLISKIVPFFKHTAVRQQTTTEARVCMDTIVQRLRNGRARTYMISTPPAATVPNSRIDFNLQAPLASGATAYAIYLAAGTVYAQEYAPPTGARTPRALASNVTGLMFAGDTTDPGIVYATLRIEAPMTFRMIPLMSRP